jgi:hypothetical protein
LLSRSLQLAGNRAVAHDRGGTMAGRAQQSLLSRSPAASECAELLLQRSSGTCAQACTAVSADSTSVPFRAELRCCFRGPLGRLGVGWSHLPYEYRCVEPLLCCCFPGRCGSDAGTGGSPVLPG